jgi:hypothetical protein
MPTIQTEDTDVQQHAAHSKIQSSMSVSIRRWSESRLRDWKPLVQTPSALTTVLDRHFGSGSGSEPNYSQIGGLDCSLTRTVDLGTIQSSSPYLSDLDWFSAGCTAGASVNIYNVLAFAI